ncbi:cysteine hydrolase [Ectobacillus sp. JY-23]|uniref:cysteine hydrolase family protein n=1 Tax=Ectobacillus sp. JY-23 TaxID=2933872 RepID=UPI001FF11338|nr:isochorismatase family cysteine hydrolase [Ectobacillus sp. JY-23]UOY91390.1 cysteine hydrolase [Ectobacillus sp. JY-23]
MKDTALLIIDMINDFDFEHGPTLAHKCREIVPAIINLKNFANQHDIPIIYINDHYNIWQTDMKKIIAHCSNTLNKTWLNDISPGESDYFLIKPHYSAFYETPLNTLLGYLKIQSLILTGIAGNICVLFTANDAHMRNYKLYVPHDCIASNSDKDNDHALQVMSHILKADTSHSTLLFTQ